MAEGGQDPPSNNGGAEKAAAAPDQNEHIPHPYMELYRHTALRGANLGSLGALVLGTPYLAYKGLWRNPGEFLRRTGSITAKGMVGVVFKIGHCYRDWEPPFTLNSGSKLVLHAQHGPGGKKVVWYVTTVILAESAVNLINCMHALHV